MENIELKSAIDKKGNILENTDSSSVKSVYPIKKVLWAGSSKYCNELIIAESEQYGKMLFTDGEIQSTSYDEKIYHEFLVHPTINIYCNLQNKIDLNVLVLGGGEGSTIRELLKYPKSIIKKIIWIDIDKDLVNLCKTHLKYCKENIYEDNRVELKYQDANIFLENNKISGNKFEIIICDLPDPWINKEEGLYTSKFWDNILMNSYKDSIIVSHLGPISPGKENFKLSYEIINQLKLNKENYKLGKVFIPSYMSEWLYLFFSPNSNIKNKCLNFNLPINTEIIDKENLNSFFYFPNYYDNPIN